MRVLDAILEASRIIFIWICVPTLIVVVFLAAAWVDDHEKKTKEQEKQITALELRLDGWEAARHFDMIEIENLADKILNECITDAPRPLKKKKWRKQ